MSNTNIFVYFFYYHKVQDKVLYDDVYEYLCCDIFFNFEWINEMILVYFNSYLENDICLINWVIMVNVFIYRLLNRNWILLMHYYLFLTIIVFFINIYSAIHLFIFWLIC